ncbi:sulfite exporter TauE/SafE family protein, partial [Candidatus Aerophobetes bacterium]|nr:sulfite exporter TauE/SafE family protein [Candidatus Aerophobetes bacterium]
GILNISFLDRQKRFEINRKPAGYAGIFLIGAAFAAGWTPCVGPILGSILFYASTTASLKKGIILLALYSLGFATPFLIFSLIIGKLLSYYKKLGRYAKIISLLSGIVLIVMGILLATGKFSLLSSGFVSLF